MKIHEYQARDILSKAGVPVPPGVLVESVENAAGAYKSVAFLRPHYQLDELSVSLRLVAELPKSAR